jgi:hypothetical protein
MTLPLPYSGIGAPLPSDPEARARELQRRLEAIEGNFQEFQSALEKPIVNRKNGIATSQSTSSTSYTTLTTPDQVENVWLPEDGLLFVVYQATWESTVNLDARAAIFLNENQLVHARPDQTNPVAQEAVGTSPGGTVQVVGSYAGGLTSYDDPTSIAPATTDYGGDVTTGQVAGGAGLNWYFRDSGDGLGGGSVTSVPNWGVAGACYIFADPGTYTVSIRFKVTSGSVTVSERKLWVWTMDL